MAAARTGRTLAVALVAVTSMAGQAFARASAPGDPALALPVDQLEAALHCASDLSGASRDPVLMIHGTALESGANFDWNWFPALAASGIPYCSVELVDEGMADLQDSAEHVVHAIRTMHEQSGRRIDIVGYSQGGMLPRWVLKWFPSTQAMIDDLVGLAADNRGTLDTIALCAVPCAAAEWQQTAGSAFLTALNDGPDTVGGIDYTMVWSRYDEVATPNLGPDATTPLHTGDGAITNVLIQDLCPLSIAEHITTGTIDPVAWAVALDALEHDGPADPARVPSSVCLEPALPGVDPSMVADGYLRFTTTIAQALAGAAMLAAEPPLRCYVTATCPTTAPHAGDDEPIAAPSPTGDEGAVPLPSTGQAAPAVGLALLLSFVLGRRRLSGSG